MTLSQNHNTYLKADLSAYVGEWIAIFQNKVIAHGANPREVLRDAIGKSSGSRDIMITKIASNHIEIYNLGMFRW